MCRRTSDAQLSRGDRIESNIDNWIGLEKVGVYPYVSKYMTIEEGDIMATGTPDGVGEIRPGDVVELEIENVCKLRNTVV